MPPGATVCLSHPHFMHQQNFVWLYFHSSNAGKQEGCDRVGWGFYKCWYLHPVPEMEQHEWCDSVLSHTEKIDRYHVSCCLSASPCLCTQRHIYALCIMCIFVCRHHWVSTSVQVCASQHGSVSVWVVRTRNNTLPWDLLNGHHLSLSAKALGKLMLQLTCFSPAARQNRHYCGRRRKKLAKQKWKRKKRAI